MWTRTVNGHITRSSSCTIPVATRASSAKPTRTSWARASTETFVRSRTMKRRSPSRSSICKTKIWTTSWTPSRLYGVPTLKSIWLSTQSRQVQLHLCPQLPGLPQEASGAQILRTLWLTQPERCEFWNFSDEIKSIEEAGCEKGMKCNKCHGWMEYRYHPNIYKKNSKKASV